MTLARRDSGNRIAKSRALVSRRLSQRLPFYLTLDEAHALIDATMSERDSLLLRLLWESGVRISEAISLRLEDVGRESIRVLGKGGIERVVFVQDGLVSSILFYAQERHLERGDYLFPSRKVATLRSSVLTRSSKRRREVPDYVATSMPIYSAMGMQSTS